MLQEEEKNFNGKTLKRLINFPVLKKLFTRSESPLKLIVFSESVYLVLKCFGVSADED